MASETATLTHVPQATRRLLKDYAEIEHAPIGADLSAHPLEDNIYEWHASMRNGPLIVHLMLVFPKSYPCDPPSVTLFTQIPHANVVASLGGYRICLDMLDVGKTKPYEGWSACYSVASILRQLQAFIFDPAFQFDQPTGALSNITTAVDRAKAFKCDKCPHTYKKPWPKFPTSAELEKKAPTPIRRQVIPLRKISTPSSASDSPPAVAAPAAEGAAGPSIEDNEGEWTVVANKKLSKQTSGSHAKLVLGSKTWAALLLASPAAKVDPVPESAKKVKAKKLVICQVTNVAALHALTIAPPVDAKPASFVSSTTRDAVIDPLLHPSSSVITSSGPFFSRLPHEILVHVVSSPVLSSGDVVALSKTCRGLYAATQDGHIWRSIFGRRTNASVTAASLQDWKTALALEENLATEEMRCSLTKVTWEEDVIGLPIIYTVNPKTKNVDYICAQEGILSRASFYTDKVRRTIWNVKFQEFLPLYLTHSHFLRALPDLQRFFLAMSPQHGTRLFRPEMAVEVLAKMMNTLIVLLCDNGLSVSSTAIQGYFVLHRLLTAFVDHYPKLERFIDNVLAKFIYGGDGARHKDAAPSLGNLLPLLTVSKSHSWSQPRVRDAFLNESADRSVLWTCTKFPKLANIPAGSCIKPDMDLLKRVWEGNVVSRRLLMFHVRVMQHFVNGVTTHCDVLFGRPPRRVVDQFQKTTKRIMNVEFWPEYHAAIMHPLPTPLRLTAQWRESVANSLRKGYHRRGMDFSAVQRSGVSRILLKGDSYTAPPDLDTVVMDETWRWAPEDGMTYLDASCSVYDFSGKHLEHVCWSRRVSTNGSIIHSGDQIDYALLLGTHKITVNVRNLDPKVKSLVFCMSAFTGDLLRIKHPTVNFHSVDPRDRDVTEALCRYDFVADESLRGKTNVVMCVLWRSTRRDRWQVTARGDVGHGTASNWAPMMKDMARVLRQL
ncbi:hypothetical protein HKX48_002136 [Thoreauomyces humboldtii]|nr:hypothetical protein HKX48_002136 [Thoreauomyces humboldtii]